MRRRRMMKNHGFTAEEKVIVTNYIKISKNRPL